MLLNATSSPTVLLTTYTFSPTGGVIKPTSRNLTTSTPNQMRSAPAASNNGRSSGRVSSIKPSGTKSYAILVTDAVGGHGLGIVHWVAYGIPASTTSLAEGVASSKDSKEYVGGTNRIKKGFYFGPCTDVGDVPHHYEFTIIALDLNPGALSPGLTKEGLFKAIKGHNLAAASFVGRYARN